MRSFLLSALSAQLSAKGAAAFRAAFNHPWIVWEPGAWKPPSVRGGTMLMPAAVIPLGGGSQATASAEALVVALVAGRSGEVTLGRGETNDVVINDATLSQIHAHFRQDAGGQWLVCDAGSRNGTWVDGKQLAVGASALLENGAQVRAAQVSLTFYTAEGILARLAGHAPKPSRR